MIASYGGMTIDKDGNRDFAGAGGAVGALSAPGRNYAYIMGAGPSYERFTPTPQGENVHPPIEPSCLPGDDYCWHPPIDPDPPVGGCVGSGCPPVDPPPNDPPTSGGCSVPGACTDREPEIDPTLGSLINRLLGSGLKSRDSSGPVYLFTSQPGTSGGGFDLKKIGIIAALAFGGWWLYNKYGK